MAVDRERLRAALGDALAPLPWVMAAWEGGSAAFSRADEHSDLDLQVHVEDGRIDDLIAVIDALVARRWGIELRYRFPEPMWHGLSQVFYRLVQAPPSLLLDLCISTPSRPNRLNERERHGAPLVLFDRAGIVQMTEIDPIVWADRIRGRVEALRVLFPMFQTLVERQLRRGLPMDALGAWHAHTLRPLVELLRIRYAPDRHDYHMRYLKADLPREVHDRLAALAFVSGLGDIEARLPEAAAWFDALLAEIGADASTTII